ncbi:MAG: tetratricopeptide repeat protein, partial [Elusimicrobiota bacterium]|nr:tetratricopeptide repeat protein [Elusimicrobiota bacterium]
AEARALLDAALAAEPGLVAARLARAAAALFDARRSRSNAGLDACLADLDATLAAWPQDGRALRLRGELRNDRGDEAGAVADLTAALRVDPADEWARAELADLHCDAGRLELALELLDAFPPARRKEGWWWALKGRALATSKDTARGLPALDRAVRLSPRSAPVVAWRGEARRVARRYRAALSDFERALALDPEFVYAHEWRARLLLMLGRPKAALESAEALAARDPRHVYGPSYKAEALFKLGRFREACETLESVYPMDPRTFWSPRVKEGARPPAAASALKADLDAAVRRHPKDAWARAFRGRCRATLGLTASARADLDAALRLDPSCAFARDWKRRLDSQR